MQISEEAALTLRTRIYGLLDHANHGHTARRVRALGITLNLIGMVSVSAGTVDALGPTARALASAVTGVVAVVFLFEYLARLWAAPESPQLHAVSQSRSRLSWALSAEGIIDLLAVIPALAIASGGARLGAESASVFVLLWVLKLATHSPGVGLIARAFHNERSALAATAALFAIVLFAAATIAHWIEGERQPEQFGSIPAALWWAVVTLTTTGYGDVVPLSAPGRLLGGLVMLCGICVLALIAGILATGFSEEVRRREFVRMWDLVARVSFFSEVGAIAISDIVGRLRSRSYPANTAVIRKGAAGDSMFFIVTGEVEVRLDTRTTALRDGDFFGEMALLDRKPRSADVVTLTPCTVLVLNVADFYQLAGQQPTLIAAIEAEAKRRRTTDRPAEA
ncbi:MAG: cyclic nucleotide-binding domain-containing protein [Betaproteobacteria bacterium]|nr:cyclic nucleotide-binding domain-containing protein [Betaproteobacteria bacterium]